MNKIRWKRTAGLLAAALILSASVSGCGAKKEKLKTDDLENVSSVSTASVSAVLTPELTPTPEQAPAGTYFSETTGEPVSEKLKDQRPIAVMIDNETIAYPHYGVAECDVLYEIMNSTLNGRITRFMAVMKDYGRIRQMGSIRSTRPTNIILASEWNAFLCHDGGPGYVKQYFAKDYAKEHFSGTFSRVKNGKPREFTEYILPGDMEKNLKRTGYSPNYNQFRPSQATHFQFVDYKTETDLSGAANVRNVSKVELPFPHTRSTLAYNQQTKTYDYYSYGKIHKDAEDGQVLTFKNAILQDCGFTKYDEHGYMIYHTVADKHPGWYITDGHAVPITWTKKSETDITRYYDEQGNELKINRGKTYISLVPSDSWNQLKLS